MIGHFLCGLDFANIYIIIYGLAILFLHLHVQYIYYLFFCLCEEAPKSPKVVYTPSLLLFSGQNNYQPTMHRSRILWLPWNVTWCNSLTGAQLPITCELIWSPSLEHDPHPHIETCELVWSPWLGHNCPPQYRSGNWYDPALRWTMSVFCTTGVRTGVIKPFTGAGLASTKSVIEVPTGVIPFSGAWLPSSNHIVL